MEYFGEAILRPHGHPSAPPLGGQLPLWLRPVSYATGTAAMQSNDLSSDNFCDELAPDGAASFIHAGRGNYCSQTRPSVVNHVSQLSQQ